MDERQDFHEWLTARRYSPKTVGAYTHYARRLDAFTSPADCDLAELVNFVQTLPQSGPSQAMARKALIVYLRFVGRDPNPAERLPTIPLGYGLPNPLAPDEYRAWIASAHALGGLHELIGVMLATTGVRQGELRKARWDDLALGEPATWRVRGKGARRAGPLWRVAALHPVAVEMLARWPRSGEFVFPGAHGYMTDKQMRRYVVDIGHHAGLGRVTAHRLRHTSGSMVLDATGNLRVAQEFLGHRNIQHTVRYTKVLPGRLSEVVALLPV